MDVVARGDTFDLLLSDIGLPDGSGVDVVTRLRDVEGVVWFVPNGQVTRIGNKSQQWSRALLDVAAQCAPASARVTWYEGIAEIPHFNPDLGDDQ